MEIKLKEAKPSVTSLWKVEVDGEEVGHVSLRSQAAWTPLPKVGIAKPRRKLLVSGYLSREAAACALAVYFYEGEREARNRSEQSDSDPVS